MTGRRFGRALFPEACLLKPKSASTVLRVSSNGDHWFVIYRWRITFTFAVELGRNQERSPANALLTYTDTIARRQSESTIMFSRGWHCL